MSAVLPRSFALSLFALFSVPALVPAQQPAFRTAVELVRLDVTVVTGDGVPVDGLSPADFEVTIKGEPRPVVSAQFLSAASAGERAGGGLEPGDFGTNGDADGRLFLIVVDELSLEPGHYTVNAALRTGDREVASVRRAVLLEP
jgi:hypothetical protein